MQRMYGIRDCHFSPPNLGELHKAVRRRLPFWLRRGIYKAVGWRSRWCVAAVLLNSIQVACPVQHPHEPAEPRQALVGTGTGFAVRRVVPVNDN
jgi:hypothetical protein